jgi:hypothetical protein
MVLAKPWQFYNNSNKDQLTLIASRIKENDEIIMQNTIWQNFEEEYCEK